MSVVKAFLLDASACFSLSSQTILSFVFFCFVFVFAWIDYRLFPFLKKKKTVPRIYCKNDFF